jgi:glycine betaine/choline ABC-type transport system substrate-binding protein
LRFATIVSQEAQIMAETISGKRAIARSILAVVAVTLALGLSSCARTAASTPTIVVGSKDTLEQQLLAEIAAQHIEYRLKQNVVRRFAIGDTHATYQALVAGEVGLYPEYAGIALAELLHEVPGKTSDMVVSRARTEMQRLEMLEYLEPLGFDARTSLVVRAADGAQWETASQAAINNKPWVIAIAEDFEQQVSGPRFLNLYPLREAAPSVTMREEALFPALAKGDVSMIVASASAPQMTSSEWKVLRDDRGTFPPADAALLVRSDVLARTPKLRAVLNELSGRIDQTKIRSLNAAVQIGHRGIKAVAADFLKSIHTTATLTQNTP